jgi:hypothetical protein
MSQKSVLQEAREVQLAVQLIDLGARLQFLEAEVDLSRERLVRLYKEIRGVSPPKGLLPFSTDWYMTWMANIHASMFYNVYLHMQAHAEGRLEALMKAFRMYRQQVQAHGDEQVLDFTRAPCWCASSTAACWTWPAAPAAPAASWSTPTRTGAITSACCAGRRRGPGRRNPAGPGSLVAVVRLTGAATDPERDASRPAREFRAE